MQESDITKMKVADLKRELKSRGLSANGNKTELMERLQAAIIDGVEGDELLDESVLTDEDEANILGDDENDLLQSPSLKINVGGEAKDKDEDDLLLSPTASTTAPKKIVLKRKSSFRELEEITISNENTKSSSEPKVLKMSERNPIKITSDDACKVETKAKVSQLSEKERLELRAKKFGQTAPVTSTTTTTTIPAITIGSNVASDDQIEKLKKRAERFGVVSPAIAKLDEQERLLKRKERFGAAGATIGANQPTDAYAEKARQRLERFKNTPITIDNKD